MADGHRCEILSESVHKMDECRELFQTDLDMGQCDDKFTMVVCRYMEDCAWLISVANAFPHSNIIIYNRGDQLDSLEWEHPQIHIVQNTCVGNEEVVYLRYIVDNYEILPDRVVFFKPSLQYNPRIINDIQYREFPLSRLDWSLPPYLTESTLSYGDRESLDEFLRIAQSELPKRYAPDSCFQVQRESITNIPKVRYRSILQHLIGYYMLHGLEKYVPYSALMEQCWTSLFFGA